MRVAADTILAKRSKTRKLRLRNGDFERFDEMEMEDVGGDFEGKSWSIPLKIEHERILMNFEESVFKIF